MTRRIDVRIGSVVADDASGWVGRETLAAAIERELAARLAAASAARGLTSRNLAKVDGERATGRDVPSSLAGAVAKALGGDV
jgi:hypothetical protein